MTPDPTLIEQVICDLRILLQRQEGCVDAGAALEELNDGLRRMITTLQGSAALPSEAQIEAGADCLRQAGTRGLNAEEAAVEVYTAMRVTTPTAPDHPAAVGGEAVEPPLLSEQLQSAGADHAPGSAARDGSAAQAQNNVAQFLSAFEKFSDDKPVCYGLTMGDLRKLLTSRSTPTAPVQDDDAPGVNCPDCGGRIATACPRCGSEPIDLSPTPETGLVEAAWREGWNLCKASLTEDEAFCLTDDVQADAWADSQTRASLSKCLTG